MNNQPFIVDPPSYKLPCVVDVPAMFHTRKQLVDTEKWFHAWRSIEVNFHPGLSDLVSGASTENLFGENFWLLISIPIGIMWPGI